MADDDAPLGADAESVIKVDPVSDNQPEALGCEVPACQSPVSLTDGGFRRRIFVGVILMLFLMVWVWADYRRSLVEPLPLNGPVVFRVEKGTTPAKLAQDLKARGLLPEPFWFRTLVWSSHASLRYGEYELAPGTTLQGLLDLLVSGKTRKLFLTVIEGWRFNQMREALARQSDLIKLTSGLTSEELMIQLGSPGQSPEGLFFPDSYRIDSRTTDLAVLRRAHRQLQSLLEQEWVRRAPDLPYKSSYEALIMASIIEKETGLAEERAQIAGVFVRRLQQGMRLQTDPTVIYGMGERYQGDIRKDDLRRDTPYNTYVHGGLPPTPIALAGRASIHAALHPAEGTSLYFVARGDGGHVFSSSLTDHQRAVNRYQKH